MNRKKQIEQFAKISEYILGHHPDEFGLVPDENGYIKIKEFLQAVTEINGWRHIRKNYINEMLLVLDSSPIEIDDTRIRSKNHLSLPKYTACENLPKLLYTCVKQKSYPSVLENGIQPTAHSKIICCNDPDMAQKIARRRSPHPVLLTVQTAAMQEQGLAFLHADSFLFLTDFIPTDCFTGPVPAKESPVTKKADKKPDPVETYKQQAQAGSFTLSLGKPDEKSSRSKKKEKDKSWKNNKKRMRKEKQNLWPEE